ncbi:regulator of protease activity HflC (stomatin/prohibitin superfamily) [Kitasatospora sp. MAP12-15]|uniref:SPFH domain-containing protein n=1 Tax=unclassified Kitasatospora TaxID=2633591 RepID=UPI00247364A6|nr:SPFH domain-containing protein [Kitasatospora sp. MAP12-44]MDH6113843.1 regulator of protease activity HflC (stomatin/prohibitin superfamily) [Kitasatospora sp. MAP12-44]
MAAHDSNAPASPSSPVPPVDGFAVEMPAPKVTERVITGAPGLPILGLVLLCLLGGAAMTITGIGLLNGSGGSAAGVTLACVGPVIAVFGMIVSRGLTAIAPGQARVVQLLGRYRGTIRADGLTWVNPFTTRRRISTRIRNHETETAKVNDADGNPIQMAAVVVWHVEDTAKALFEVDDFVEFVAIQTETAVRHIANSYPYDAHTEGQMSLRDSAEEITRTLSAEIGARVASAGVRVVESRITRLAYAPEVAQVMLQRQQAGAVVAARRLIVEGAVGMVELALDRLAEQNVVELDEERKAAMVSNLLVVLCGDRGTQPVVNTGSLYQ